ncbi:EamA family transporter [Phormidium sp. CLA17]|uniref:EamA family transporter n=1 Tax=Leptolyngbya sp. Cla-17 TaxID=2803751 RepID=UPI001491FD6A|nr:EamA family transporter [Leptolyngbya sp. Cla-17]MBM0743935.1 EamA family transporter [Leptolyngbya sp. Cla-17]
MTLQEFFLFLSAILMASGGQFLLKLGAGKLGKVSANNFVSHILNIALTPELVAGLALYAFSSIFFILVLTRVKLSVAGPAISISYIFSVLLGYFFFQESISRHHLIGLGLIVAGVVLVVKR